MFQYIMIILVSEECIVGIRIMNIYRKGKVEAIPNIAPISFKAV